MHPNEGITLIREALAEPRKDGTDTIIKKMEIIGDLRHSLLHALAERDDALWMLARISLESEDRARSYNDVERALRNVRLLCDRALAGSRRIKEDD